MKKSIYYKNRIFDIDAFFYDKYNREIRDLSNEDTIEYLLWAFKIDLNEEKEVIEEKIVNALIEELDVVENLYKILHR